MSIASQSVVGRILAEVGQGASIASLSSARQVAEPLQVFELRRTRHVHEPPFATSFHFWAHALRAFLLGQGRLDLFDALASQGLCERFDGETAATAFADLDRRMASRVGTVEDLEPDRLRVGYRMIDQAVMVSWVGESKCEQRAVFWARPRWLASARPIEFPAPEDADAEPQSTR